MEGTNKNIISSFKVHEELDPDIWFMDNGSYKMIPEIRVSLLDIVDDYKNFVNVDMEIEDVNYVSLNYEGTKLVILHQIN